MVNFTDSATVEDLATPESAARFEEFYRTYAGGSRLAGNFKVHHVWCDGLMFQSCDFGFRAASLELLIESATAALLALKPNDEIPVQPRELWWEFWRVPNLKFFMNWRQPTHRRASVFVAVRGLKWP